MQGPILDEVAKNSGNNAIVAKVNVDEEPSLASQFGVQSIPTLLIIKEGQILNRMVGVQSAQVLAEALQKAGA
jgi:thioredoxin 1